MSDFDMEDEDEEEDASDDEAVPFDIRSLVHGKGIDAAEPPKKKQKK